MNLIKDSVTSIASFLNNHKERIKNLVDAAKFGFGTVIVYDAYQRSRKPSNTIQNTPTSTEVWAERTDKIILFSARISLFLNATTSRYGVLVISRLMNTLFSSAQLERIFGPNINFVGNPWHPRHICNIGAVLIVFPFLLQSMYRGVVSCTTSKPQATLTKATSIPDDSLVGTRVMTAMIIFTVLFSRCVLHLGNAFYRMYLR